MKASVDANKASTDAVKTSVDANKASTDAVKTSVDANKASTDAVKTSVDANKASTDGVKDSVDALGPKLDGIKNAVDGVKTSTDDNGKLLKDIKDALNNDNTGNPSDGSDHAGEDKNGECPYGADDLRCNGADPWAQFVPDPLDDPKGPEDMYQSFKGELGNGPLGPVLSFQAAADASDSCPTFTIPASRYWPAQTVDAHCQVYDAATPIIYRIMTWAWAFIGLWILIY